MVEKLLKKTIKDIQKFNLNPYFRLSSPSHEYVEEDKTIIWTKP